MKSMSTEFQNPPVEMMSKRIQPLYSTLGDTRSEFFRDYCRILHSNAYRRLKHKTQVFFNVGHDHVCTRMEHVQHVESVSHSLAMGLGLDVELTQAIAIGHDLGHAPFGHHGEMVLNELIKEHFDDDYKIMNYGSKDINLFWHERNGLRFADDIELLSDAKGVRRNLNLTYAVRDGIISHCGEIDENVIRPRDNAIDLKNFKKPGEYMPFTWEGCVVKIADKIAYLGRDIEDAIILNFISDAGLNELKSLARNYTGAETLNTTGIMHSLIGDICANSSQECGLRLSKEKMKLLVDIKSFNYRYIYKSEDLNIYKEYAKLVLSSIFRVLYKAYDGKHTISQINSLYENKYPRLSREFVDWLSTYCVDSIVCKQNKQFIISNYANEKIYSSLDDKNIYCQAIIDFISGMTDAFAIEMFNELISF